MQLPPPAFAFYKFVKWTISSFIEKILNIYLFQIYSVVSGVLRVNLLGREGGKFISINEKLISMGFAVKAEEFYLSKVPVQHYRIIMVNLSFTLFILTGIIFKINEIFIFQQNHELRAIYSSEAGVQDHDETITTSALSSCSFNHFRDHSVYSAKVSWLW